MIKIFIGFVIFAALGLFILMKSGGDIDMGVKSTAPKKPPTANRRLLPQPLRLQRPPQKPRPNKSTP